MSRLRHRAALLTAVGCLAATTGLLAAPAGAEGQTYNSIVSENPYNDTPDVEDGAVRSIARVGSTNTMVAVGNFTSVTQPNGQTLPRTNIFAFDRVTGVVSTTFVPQVNAAVNRVVDSADGQSVYIGGKFSQLNGQNVPKVARINATTGQEVTSFNPPALNGQVFDMVREDGSLWLAGAFKKVGPADKSGLVALDPGTGADTGRVSSTFTNTFNGGTVSAKALDVSEDGDHLVTVGNFRTVDGQSRVQIAMFNTSVSPATLASWSTTRYSGSCSGSFDSYMRDVSIAPDASYFAVATTGAFAGGVGSGTLCDTAARFELTPGMPNAQPSWADYTGGDTLLAVQATGRSIYLGGHQRWLNNPFAGDRAGQGAVSRSGIAVLDARNGLPFSWNPGRPRGVGLREFLTLPDGVWVAHDTNRLGGEERKRVGFFPLAGGEPIPPDNTGSLPGQTFSMGSLTTSADDGVQRSMTSTGPTSAAPAPTGGIDWSSSRGTFMVDGQLFAGFSNGTFTRRTFNGTTFGAPTTENLNGLTNFAGELPNVTGMFFDRATGRMYFTLAGQSRLFYRYFLPESGIVGAVRFDGPANTAGIDWTRTAGMFLANGRLYIADRLDGNLRSVQWTAGQPVNGTLSTVSGPGVDGNDWRARSLFLLAS